tara:strand:- start:3566 stop:4078 length:513 start_codon:yes stop_codon:yes gene_type:complete
MAGSVSNQIEAEVQAHLQQSYNRLIATIMRRLATKKRSPVYTGFFASSWKVNTSPIVAKDKVEDFSPWSEIRQRKAKDPKSKEYKIDQRFYPPSKVYSYKRRVYIGNAAEYSIYALESGKVQQFVQGTEMKALVDAAFKERKTSISVGSRQGIGTFGTQAGSIYTGYTEL